MTEAEFKDSRTDILNRLVVRVAVLEEKSNEHIISIKNHETVIDKLLDQDHELLLSLNKIASKLEIATISIGAKSDKLIGQFNTGFKVLSVCTGALIVAIGAFYTYSKDLDAKYMPKFDSLVRNTAANRGNYNDEEIKDMKNDIETIAKKRVIKASK